MQITIVTPEKGITYQEQVNPINNKKADTGFSEALAVATSNADVNAALGVPQEYASIFATAAEKYGVDYSLLVSMAKQESGFNPNARSGSGAMGIMQLMPSTAAGLGVTDGYDPYQNIMAGAEYISRKLQEFNGDTSLALAAYNAGSGAVRSYGGIPPYSETQNYVRNILGYMNLAKTTRPSQTTAGVAEQASAANQNAGATVNTEMPKAQAAEQLEQLLAEFSEHESYGEFLDRLTADLESQGLLEEAETATEQVEGMMPNLSLSGTIEESDAETAYKTLLGSMNRVILSIINENP